MGGEPLAEDGREVGDLVRVDDDPGSRAWTRSAIAFVIGPVPAPSSTITSALAQSTLPTVALESQGLLGATLAILVPWLEEFAEK